MLFAGVQAGVGHEQRLARETQKMDNEMLFANGGRKGTHGSGKEVAEAFLRIVGWRDLMVRHPLQLFVFDCFVSFVSPAGNQNDLDYNFIAPLYLHCREFAFAVACTLNR